MFGDMKINDRVTRNLISKRAGFVVGRTIEGYRLIITDREGSVFVVHRLHRQVQTIERHDTILLFYAAELTTLTGRDCMPFERYLIWAYDRGRVDCIYVIYNQFQYLYRVATKAIRAVEIMSSGLLIGYVMPGVFVTLIHIFHVPNRIRIDYAQGHMNHTVATAYMVGIGILTTLTQALVTKGDTGSLTYRLLQIRIRDKLHLQIQDILDAVLRNC